MISMLVLAWLLPLALAPLALFRPAQWWMVLGSGAAIAASLLLGPGQQVEVAWLLLGSHLVWDELSPGIFVHQHRNNK